MKTQIRKEGFRRKPSFLICMPKYLHNTNWLKFQARLIVQVATYNKV